MAIAPKQQQGQQKAEGASLAPSSWVEGGSLFDDFDGTIKEMAFVQWDYNGKTDPGLALAVEIQNEEAELNDGDGQKNPFIQYYSAGKLENFVPSDDGKEAIPVGSKTGLSKGTNAYKFLMSTIAAGFDASLIGKRVDIFEGARFHFKKENTDKVAEENKKSKGDFERKPQLLAEQLLSMPGEAAKQPKTAAKAAAAPPRPTAVPPKKATTTAAPTNGHTVSDEVLPYVQAYILEKLADNNGSHPKMGLAKDLVNWAKANGLDIPTRNKVIQALGNEAFLSQTGNGWTFDGETLNVE